MSWDGTERRASVQRDNFCSQHLSLATDLAVIKECAKNIEQKMVEGTSFRNGVVIALITIAFALVVQVATFSYLYGQITRQVEVNTRRLFMLEACPIGANNDTGTVQNVY